MSTIVPRDLTNNTPAYRSEWDRVKAISQPPGDYTHISCTAQMIEDPAGKHLPKIAYVSPGRSYKAGRNIAKRARRGINGAHK